MANHVVLHSVHCDCYMCQQARLIFLSNPKVNGTHVIVGVYEYVLMNIRLKNDIWYVNATQRDTSTKEAASECTTTLDVWNSYFPGE